MARGDNVPHNPSGNRPSRVPPWGDLSGALEADVAARLSCQSQTEKHIQDKAQVNESNVLTEDKWH